MRLPLKYSKTSLPALSLAAISLVVFIAACTGTDEPPVTPTTDPTLLPTEFRPTVGPTPTTLSDLLNATVAPNDLYGDVKLTLLARSVPGATDGRFTAFDVPVISSNGLDRSSEGHRTIVGFIGFDGLGNASVYYDIPAERLPQSPLNELAQRGTTYSGDNEWIGPLSGGLTTQDGELVLFRGRYRDKDGEFIDGIFSGNWTGVKTLAVEGPVANFQSDADRIITQFNSFIYAPDGTVYFNGPVSSDGIWHGWSAGSSVSKLQEGEGLEDLDEDWRVTRSGNLIFVGATENAMVLLIKDARWPLLHGGTEIELDSGAWRFATVRDESEAVAVSGTMIDNTEITWLKIFNLSISGADPEVIGFIAQYEEVGFDHVPKQARSVWKWLYKEVKHVKVATEGDKFSIGAEFGDADRELFSLDNAVADSQGRMIFSASTWTESNDLIGLVIKENLSGELELVARTDKLPGSTYLERFAPQQVSEIATNKVGGVAFVTGIGEGLWAEDGAGRLKKVVEIGDQLEVNGETKTVQFIDFAGGGNTTSGLPSGLSDNGDLVFRVQFADGSEALYYATFSVQ